MYQIYITAKLKSLGVEVSVGEEEEVWQDASEVLNVMSSFHPVVCTMSAPFHRGVFSARPLD